LIPLSSHRRGVAVTDGRFVVTHGEAPISELVDQDFTDHQGLLHVFLPRRAAVVVPDPQLRRRHHPALPQDHPALPQVNRVRVAEAAGRPAGRQALLVLAYLKKGETFSDLAKGFEVGLAAAWRCVDETVDLLAARAPKLRKAVRDAKRAGHNLNGSEMLAA
jgi:Helix-turn-helix of DDE superfamily endonuclease